MELSACAERPASDRVQQGYSTSIDFPTLLEACRAARLLRRGHAVVVSWSLVIARGTPADARHVSWLVPRVSCPASTPWPPQARGGGNVLTRACKICGFWSSDKLCCADQITPIRVHRSHQCLVPVAFVPPVARHNINRPAMWLSLAALNAPFWQREAVLSDGASKWWWGRRRLLLRLLKRVCGDRSGCQRLAVADHASGREPEFKPVATKKGIVAHFAAAGRRGASRTRRLQRGVEAGL